MSVFDDEIRDDEASLFREAGDPADYAGQLASATDIQVILERDFEGVDEDGVAVRVSAISVLVSDIPISRMGDIIRLDGRDWRVHYTLMDDGHVRRLQVT